MYVEDFYVPISMVLPKLDRVFAANVNIYAAAGIIGFSTIRKRLRGITNGHETVS